MGSYHAEVPSPDVSAFIDFAAQAKPVQFVSAEASALHTGDATGTQGIGVWSAEVC